MSAEDFDKAAAEKTCAALMVACFVIATLIGFLCGVSGAVSIGGAPVDEAQIEQEDDR